ncbi:hypothetical protein TWF102_009433 [Orbilia oligospora]|uniref:BTB domain-containing protein n=1 Tax=Orbilia oligospora TaxID=2813651 RepID=A0A7C8N477_ORBOL|nr:hypothetical protein TWF102_009433 [Orbilia oligospora]KAF3094345.1 hypothetical protein TWF103_010543 [Orbilia oligospora]
MADQTLNNGRHDGSAEAWLLLTNQSGISTVQDTDSNSTVPWSPIRTDANSDSLGPGLFVPSDEGDESGEDDESDEDTEYYPSTSLPVIFVSIADNYDCIVTVSSECETTKFRVSEKVLSVSSPVLRNLITEAKTRTSGAVDPIEADDNESSESENSDFNTSLTLEGDPSAFKIVFQVIHFQGDGEQLKSIEFKVFTQIVWLCEKYGLHKALRKWTRFWRKKYEPHALEPGYENWLYIADALKKTKHVEKLSTLLGRDCGIFPAGRSPEGPGQGRFFSRNGQVVDASLWPPMTFFRISRIRDGRVNHLILHIKALLLLVEYPSKSIISGLSSISSGFSSVGRAFD